MTQDKPELVVISGPHRGLSVFLDSSKEIYVGRSKSADLCLTGDKKVSQLHAKLLPVGPKRFILEDLGSTNGTYVNGKRMEQTPVQSGDRLKIGHSLLIYRTDAHDIHASDFRDLAAASSGVSEGEDDLLMIARRLVGSIVRADNATIALEESLATMCTALGTTRGLGLLRDTMTATIQRIAAHNDSDAPLDPELLRQVAAEESAQGTAAGAVAAPLRIAGAICGALYFDGGAERFPFGEEKAFVELIAGAVSLALSKDRQRQAADAAIEVVELTPLASGRHAADLSAILQPCIDLYREVAAARQIPLFTEVPGGLTVSCDEIILNRALERMCEYVVTIAQGPVRISARGDEGSPDIEVCFAYKGRGFDANGLKHVFHEEGVPQDFRFALDHGLDGVLAFCRGVLELCQGELRVESDGPDGGALFTMVLPVAHKGPSESTPSGRTRRSRTERYF